MRGYALLLMLILLVSAIPGNAVLCQEASVSATDVAIAIDDSPSMRSNTSSQIVKDSVSKLLAGLSPDSQISIAIFSDKAHLAMPLTSASLPFADKKIEEIMSRIEWSESKTMIPLTVRKGDTLWDFSEKYYGNPYKWRLIMEVNNITDASKELEIGTVIYIPVSSKQESDSFTDIPSAVEMCSYELGNNGRPNSKKAIILLTDGALESGMNIRYSWLKDELSLSAKQSGTGIYSMVLSPDGDFELFQTLAHNTDGGYYRVYSSDDVPAAVGGILSSINASVAPVPVVEERVSESASTKSILSYWKYAVLALVIIGISGIAVYAFTRFNRRAKPVRYIMIPEAHLVDVDGVTGQASYPINRKVLKIGRSYESNHDILIERDTVSSNHGEIEYRDRKFYVKDLDSRNGTYINDNTDRIVDAVALKDGDIVIFDQYKFRFQMPSQGRRIRVSLDQEPSVVPAKPAVASNKTILSKKKVAVDDSGSKTVLRPGVGSNATVLRQGNASPQENQTVLRPGGADISTSSPPQVSPVSVSGQRPEADTEDALDIPTASLIDTGDVTGRQAYVLRRKRTLIGRQRQSVDICLDKGTVSGMHAQIEYRDNVFYLSDLSSRNGTYINESRDRLTSEVALNDGAIIYFDQYRFQFVMNSKAS